MQSAVRSGKGLQIEVAETESHTSGIDRCDTIHRWNGSPRLGSDNIVESTLADRW
jgi:hypothetical protein